MLSASVHVVAHVDLSDVVEEHLVVDVGVPSLVIVDMAETWLLHVSLVVVSVESVEPSHEVGES